MKAIRHILLVLLLGLGALAHAAENTKSPAILLQEAIYQEETAGDLDKAIELYGQVLEQAAEVERLAARATYQLALCHLKKGDEATAAKYFRKAGRDYPKQTSVARKAQEQLQKISSVDDIIAQSYVIHYKTINTSEDGLIVFNQKHPKGVKTHHANRYKQNGERINSICTDTKEEAEKIVEMISQNPQLELVKVVSPQGQDGSQIILEDSFEDGIDEPTGWQKGTAVDGVSYIWDKNTGSDGNASLCLKKDVEKYFPIAQWTRRIEYTGNAKELTVSANVRAKKAYKAIIDTLFLDDKGEWIKHEWTSYIGAKEAGDKPANHNWKEYSGAVEIPDNTKTIVVGLQMYGPGTVWFDELEAAYTDTSAKINPQALVEDFFKHNYRDITSRKTLEWGEPTTDESGNISIRYKYEATIWDKDKKINNQIFTFDKDGQFISVVDAKPDPLKAENLIAEGWELWGQRKLAEAEDKFSRAVRSDPENDGAYQGLGWAQLNQGKKLNAEISFKKCVKLNPKNAAALNGLGWIAHGQDKKAEAIKWWEKAIEAQPGATAALNGLTQTYMEMEQYGKAIKYYELWLKAEPNNQDAINGLEKAKSLMK